MQGWGVCVFGGGGGGEGVITVCVVTCRDKVGACVCVWGGGGVIQSVYLLVETGLGRMWGCWVWEYYSMCTYLLRQARLAAFCGSAAR